MVSGRAAVRGAWAILPQARAAAAQESPRAQWKRQRIAVVMAGSRPSASNGSQHVVPFHGHYLVFVASKVSPGTLVLAAVERQPQ
jgi:hypothetical protein